MSAYSGFPVDEMRMRLAVYNCQLQYFEKHGIEPDWLAVNEALDRISNQSSVIEVRKYSQGIKYGTK